MAACVRNTYGQFTGADAYGMFATVKTQLCF